jgi:small conductance mechanosensitive channel
MLEERRPDLMVGMHGLLPLIGNNALNVLGAVVILLIGLWLSSKADLLVVSAALRRDAEELLRQPRALPGLTATVLAVLSPFGIPTTSLVAVLGAAEHKA